MHPSVLDRLLAVVLVVVTSRVHLDDAHPQSSMASRTSMFLDDAHVIRYQIDEEVPRGTVVGNVIDDADLLKHFTAADLKQIRFRFLAESPTSGSAGGGAQGAGAAAAAGGAAAAGVMVSGSSLFEIGTSSGIIRTATEIDRDSASLCRQRRRCELNIDVVTQPVQLFQIIKITVEIMDINDNSPRFRDQLIHLQVIEAAQVGSVYIVPTAVDVDGPDNGVQRYELDSPSPDRFSLDVSTKLDGSADVRLQLRDRVDRETQAEYRLKLVAYDGGSPPRSGTMTIVVVVLDSNDNRPEFGSPQYELTVVENLPVGSTIGRVDATDLDAGLNGLVSYAFAPQTQSQHGSLFGIRNSTGEIFVRGTIDHEVSSVYQLLVVAHDNGPDTLSSETMVVVHVEDLNDNSPAVTVHTLDPATASVAEISEDSPIGSFVAYVSAADPDAGVNGRVDCAIGSGASDGAFTLVMKYPSEYQIVTATSLDRERSAQYSLTVKCWDGAPIARITERPVRIVVTDVNDNAPIFSQQTYRGSIVENNYIGASVLQVTASDWDTGDNSRVTYTIPGNVGSYFHVDQLGVLSVHGVVDREKYDTFRFPILAVDGGRPALTGSALVVITVEDVDDEKPRFVQSQFNFEVFENEPPGTVVGLLKAEDRDAAPYNRFLYGFQTGSTVAETAFAVEAETGKLTLRHPLDRERHARHQFVVVAYDPKSLSTSSGTAAVVVNVLDRNDNAPAFSTGNLSVVNLSSLAPPGHVVVTVTARDPDVDENGRLSYSLRASDPAEEPSTSRLFRIDPTRGSIIVNGNLPSAGWFQLTVVVSDHGSPPMSSTQQLSIYVNRTLPYQSSAAATGPDSSGTIGGSLSRFNLVVVVAIVCGCSVVIFVLIVAIALVRHRDRRRHIRKYNCRMEALRMLTSGGNGDVASSAQPEVIVGTPTTPPGGPRLVAGPASIVDGCVSPTKVFQNGGVPAVSIVGGASPNSKSHDTSSSTEKDSVHSLEGDGSVTDSGRGPSEEGGDAGTSGHGRSQIPNGRGGPAGGERYLPPPPPPPRGGAYWAQQQLQQRHHHPSSTGGNSHPTVRFHGLTTMPEEDSNGGPDDAEGSSVGGGFDGTSSSRSLKPIGGRQVGRRGAANGGLRSGLSLQRGGRQHPARVHTVSGCDTNNCSGINNSTTHLLQCSDSSASSLSYPTSGGTGPSSTSSLGRKAGRGGSRLRGGGGGSASSSASGSPVVDGLKSSSDLQRHSLTHNGNVDERSTSSLSRQPNGGHFGRLYCDNSVVV